MAQGIPYNDFITNPILDTKVWYMDDGTASSIVNSYNSLWAFAHLARMYRVLITDTLQKLSSTNANYLDHYNNIKFGIPNAAFLNGGFSRYSQFFASAQVKNYIGNTAYIIHPYYDQNNFIKKPLTAKTNATISDLNTEFAMLRDSMEISYNQRFFKKSIISDINTYPINSEFWFTEWNFLFDWDNLKKAGNTMLHAMYYYDVMMNFMDINANKNLQISCNKTNPIKLCNYHLPYCGSSDETWYNMIRFSNGYNTSYIDPYTTTNSSVTDVKYNATYYTHQLLKPILNDTSVRYINVVNGGFANAINCSFRTFVKAYNSPDCLFKDIYLYFNNKSDTNRTIAVKTALNKQLSGNCIEDATMSFLQANNLYASMGKTTFRTSDNITADPNISIQRMNNIILTTSNIDNVIIPKYSVGYIKIRVISTLCCSSPLRLPKNSTQKEFENKKFKVYPNPTVGILNFEFENEASRTIEIFDNNGRIVKTFNVDKDVVAVDLSSLAKGIYVYKIIEDGNLFKTSKFIIE